MLLFLVHAIWTVFTITLGVMFVRQARKHGNEPALEYSSRDKFTNYHFGRFMRKMSFAVVGLCLLSAWVAWSSMFWAIVILLAIPAVVALQVVRGRKALENSYKRGLPS